MFVYSVVTNLNLIEQLRYFLHPLVQLIARAFGISEVKRSSFLVTKTPLISAKLLHANMAGCPIKSVNC